MNSSKNITYSTYGTGSKILLAFHGYGMDGNQFQILEKSICHSHQVIGFHLPYHNQGASDHKGWMSEVISEIEHILDHLNVHQFSIAGYSIGAKIALNLIGHFKGQVEKIYLFAPFGLENHWGLSFVSKGLGNAFFKAVVKTNLPEYIMRLVTQIGIIDQVHFLIIQKELDTKTKRLNLCRTLQMTGEIDIDLVLLTDTINEYQIETEVIYGEHDVLFPFHGRNKSLLQRLNRNKTLMINESHWLITQKLDELLCQQMIIA